MRLKLTISFDQEVNTSIIRLKFQNNAFLNFDLMIVLVTNKLIMRSKLKKSIFREFQSHEQLLVTSAIMRSKVFTHRWLIIRAETGPT